MPAKEVVLVTGYPSMLARAVCAEVVLQDSQATVQALVPPHQLDEARGALSLLPPEHQARVQFVEGDAASIDLGLSRSELERLWADVTRIHHCAQTTHFGADRADAERINVGGAQEAVDFALHCPR